MPVELKVPNLGESVTEAIIGRWLKQEGDYVEKDEPIAELESDKANVELPAPVTGTLIKQLKAEGETAEVGETIGQLTEGNGQAKKNAGPPTKDKKQGGSTSVDTKQAPKEPETKPDKHAHRLTPVAQRMVEEHQLDPDQIEGTGPGGRVTKSDVNRHLEQQPPEKTPEETPDEQAPDQGGPTSVGPNEPTQPGREEELVPMSPLRKTIARRLVEGQQAAAVLTTFNEIDMSAVMDLRQQYGKQFEAEHGVRLGFMSFFVVAVIDMLQRFPQLNAEIRGDKIAYRNYQDIGIAVSTDRGLLVPVIRNAERLGFAEIEKAINDYAARARDRKLQIDELQGGTFTITNGGVFGSLLSTPLLNPPQSGVLGMHTIQKRPVAVDDQVVIRPMMYVALSYDHRIIDGREAVTALKQVKDAVESPARMLLGL